MKRRSIGQSPSRMRRTPAARRFECIVETVFYGILALAFCWPMSSLSVDRIFMRQFDYFGVIWTAAYWAAPGASWTSSLTAWPMGESLRRMDSNIFGGLARLMAVLMTPARFSASFGVIGLTISAWAAARCAREGFGVSRPASLAAGIVYAFNGLSATALLEGHIYFLLDPWLPLLLLSLRRLGAPDGRWTDGIRAGLYWTASLLTSAYLGLLGGILAAAELARGFWIREDGRAFLRRASGFIGLGCLSALAYLDFFLAGGGGKAGQTGQTLEAGSATLIGLTTWVPNIDLYHHSIASPLGFALVALLLLGQRLIRWAPGWRLLAVFVLAVPLCALGPRAQMGLPSRLRIETPMMILEETPLGAYLHFPVRFMWLYYLCAGLVAALILERLRASAGNRSVYAVIAVLVADAFIGSAVPLRMGNLSSAVPSAYSAAPSDRAVLDFFAAPPFDGYENQWYFERTTCYYQSVHRRAVLQPCIQTYFDNPRRRVSSRLFDVILARKASSFSAQEAQWIRDLMASMGVGAVAVHLDLIPNEFHDDLLEGFRALFGPARARSSDGGEHIVLFVIDGMRADNPREVYERLITGELQFRRDERGAR